MQPAMNILFVQETNWLDRPPIIQHQLAERLAQRGHQVRVIDYDALWPQRTPRTWWQPRQEFPAVSRVIPDVALNVTRPATARLPLACHVSWTGSSLWELRRLLRARWPDVVVGLTLTNSYLMALLLKQSGTPYVNMALEPYHTMPPQRWAQSLARFVERGALRSAQRVAIFAPRMRAYMDEMGVDRERVEVFKTVVDTDLFRPDVDGAATRVAYGIAPEETVILFVGWLYEFSGLREILQAIAADPTLLDGARLVIVGDGAIRQELQERVEQHRLAGRVILPGLRPHAEIPAFIAAADVCLLPFLENDTTRNIGPMKVYEYQASGRPVVACVLPGLLSELGLDSGVVWADNPVDALGKAIELAGRPDEVQRLAQLGRQYAEQSEGWSEVTDRFEQLLQRVAADAHP